MEGFSNYESQSSDFQEHVLYITAIECPFSGACRRSTEMPEQIKRSL